MKKEGPVLGNFIKDYRKRMALGEMKTQKQQFKLSWQIEWIWHVHSFHPSPLFQRLQGTTCR